MSRYHLIPDDKKEHILSPSCWCKPSPDEDHEYWTHKEAENARNVAKNMGNQRRFNVFLNLFRGRSHGH